jgi:RsiW-degrading membrane proteinase PrsW (M82 family)
MPVKSWFHDRGWRDRVRLAVIPYALLPLLFGNLLQGSANLTTPGWAYSLYIAPLWAFAFWLLIRPGRLGRLEVVTGAAIVVWVLACMHAVTGNIDGRIVPDPNSPMSFIQALGVGFNEETTKALPVLIAALVLLRWRKQKVGLRMWMFLGTLSGLTFGVDEQQIYTSNAIYNATHAQYYSDAVASMLAFGERIFVDGTQHAVWAGIAAFFVGMAVNYPRRRVELLIFAVSVPAVLHGLNDWAATSNTALMSNWVEMGVQALSLLLFLGYTMSARSIEREVRRTPMFRGESIVLDDGPSVSEAEPAASPWSIVLGPADRGHMPREGG